MTDATGRTPTRPSDGRRARDLPVILGVSLLTLGVVFGSAELYLRLTEPFVSTNWPGRLDPRVGTLFKPGEVMQWTNGVDFWTRTRVNSLGFLDREPPPPRTGGRPDGRCRVLFIGDSFVQAGQVPIDQKSHVVFERLAREQLPALGIETLAFGYSGTGQANQLGYYEFFGPALRPDIVLLVVSANDFANNSPLLESARYGWHPLHLPRLFFAVAPDGGEISRLGIDPDWRRYRLSAAFKTPRPLHRVLHEHSYFYHWLFTHLEAHLPAPAALLSGQSRPRFIAARLRDIEKIDGFSQAFAQWNYPHDLDTDTMFNAEYPLPPAFEQALRLTGHALDEFQRHARSDGFQLLLLAGHGVTRRFEPGTLRKGRTLRDRGAMQRLEALAAARDIPLIDQYRFILSKGGTISAAGFSRDAHWSEQGHVWAAEAVLEHFRRNPQVCAPHHPG